MTLGFKTLIAAGALAAFVPLAHAGSVGLTLTRTTLTNVSDAAGLWQHQAGNIMKGGVKVGQYLLHRNGGSRHQGTRRRGRLLLTRR